jgi:hypothetical protein
MCEVICSSVNKLTHLESFRDIDGILFGGVDAKDAFVFSMDVDVLKQQ